MKKVLSLILCVVLGLSFSACDQTDTSATSVTTVAIDDGDPYTFESVAEAKAAIKKEPLRYENSQITVKGSIVHKENSAILSNLRGSYGAMFRVEALRAPKITIIMSDKKLVTLLEDGDYVKIIGTVKISHEEIYLDGCEYEMIESIYD